MTNMISVNEALRRLDADDYWRRFQVDYPEAQKGRFEITEYQISRRDQHRLDIIRNEGMDRDPGYGTFRKLVETTDEGERVLWMSDTRAEIMEHTPLFNKLFWSEMVRDKRLLINGLGLGVVVHGALTYEGVGHVDVVEANADVAALITPLLPRDKVTVHVGDAYDMTWPPGTRWDFAWHDIWPTISDENLPGMDRLLAKYRRRTAWQGCWQRKGCLKMARMIRAAQNGTLDLGTALDMLGGKWHL